MYKYKRTKMHLIFCLMQKKNILWEINCSYMSVSILVGDISGTNTHHRYYFIFHLWDGFTPFFYPSEQKNWRLHQYGIKEKYSNCVK